MDKDDDNIEEDIIVEIFGQLEAELEAAKKPPEDTK